MASTPGYQKLLVFQQARDVRAPTVTPFPNRTATVRERPLGAAHKRGLPMLVGELTIRPSPCPHAVTDNITHLKTGDTNALLVTKK
jgi:hypothetical protein